MKRRTFIVLSCGAILAIILLFFLCGGNRTTIGNLGRWFNDPSNHLFFLNRGYRGNTFNLASRGYWRTGQLLVNYHGKDERGEEVYLPTESSGDDLGLFLLLPQISRMLGDEDASPRAYLLFSWGVWSAGFALGLTGIMLLFQSRLVRALAVLMFGFFAALNLYILDVYLASYLAVCAVPLILFLLRKRFERKELGDKGYGLFLSMTGLLMGACDLVRSTSGTGVLVFVAIYLLFIPRASASLKQKFLAIVVLVVFSMAPRLGLKAVQLQRDRWLADHHLKVGGYLGSHPAWHNMFLGLAYVSPNPHQIEWKDQYAFDLANRLHPELKAGYSNWSPAYDEFIRGQFLLILREDPFFVFKSFALKALKALGWCLVFFNVSAFLVFLARPRLGGSLKWAFLLTIAFYSLPGILVWPFPMYLISAMGMAMILNWVILDDLLGRKNGVPRMS